MFAEAQVLSEDPANTEAGDKGGGVAVALDTLKYICGPVAACPIYADAGGSPKSELGY